jgi:hypothetical protein
VRRVATWQLARASAAASNPDERFELLVDIFVDGSTGLAEAG